MSAKIFARSWVLAFDRIQVPGDIVMDTDRSQNKGSLDELAARLTARYEQELRELAAESCRREEKAVFISEKVKEQPRKTSQYSDAETDAQMRANSGWGFGSALTVDDEAENKAVSLVLIWIAIGALTWLFAAPQLYASPALFVVNILIRPQLAAMAGVVMLAAVWLSIEMSINSYWDLDLAAIFGYAACAYGFAWLCGWLLPFPGMEEVFVRCIELYFSVLVCAPIIALLALIFPVLWLTFAPFLLFHYLVDRVIIKTWWPVRSVPSLYDKR